MATSCYFYMAFVPIYILILLLTIVVDYIAGIMIERAQGNRRKWFLVMSIVANVGVLMFFKYYNFFADNLNALLHIADQSHSIPLLKMVLPIGLSFHTFQAMSYTIEVYRGHHKAEKHFGIYALYVMFYPQLVAGPIERPQNILFQFHEPKKFSFGNLDEGLKLMLWGFFKKIVIADRLALVANPVFNHPAQYTGVQFFIATIFFTFQIYCDFSGYSDIALGTAKIMGFTLMENFNRPYFSKSIGEFWTRWHISLSSWFRDYLYIPLGGSRVKVSRHYLNLSIVFLVSGFWHGANWTFIIWGALHALYLVLGLVANKATRKAGHTQSRLPHSKHAAAVATFVCVAFAWIFFRANNVADAFYILRHLGSGWSAVWKPVQIKGMVTQLGGGDTIAGLTNIVLGALSILFLEFVQLKTRGRRAIDWLFDKPRVLRWGFYYSLILLILIFGVFDNSEFIYFQF